MRFLPLIAISIALLGPAGAACTSSTPGSLLTAGGGAIPAPDGIDPNNPNIERSSRVIDFSGIETIRLELPTGRVSVSQSAGADKGSIQVTEIIVKEGLGPDLLEELLSQSAVAAERSFVDDARLDVEATVAETMTEEDIVFDVSLVVPHGVNLEILVGNGPVEISELTGNIEIRTHNGAIDVTGVRGSVVAETSNRPVSVIDASGNVRARTTDADVTLRLTPPAEAEIEAETTIGTIRLTVAQTTAASLSLRSLEGAVNADLKGFAVSDITTGDGFLEGVLNGGGGRIEAKAIEGEIDFSGMAAG